MTVQLDLARSSDAAQIVTLRGDAADWMAERGIVQWARGELTIDQIAEQVERREWLVVHGQRDRAVIGALRLAWSDPSLWGELDAFAGYVHGIVVDRRHVGGGMGAAMLDRAADRARREHATLFRLDCVEANARLRRYYADLAFIEVGRREISSPFRSVVLLEKRLDDG